MRASLVKDPEGTTNQVLSGAANADPAGSVAGWSEANFINVLQNNVAAVVQNTAKAGTEIALAVVGGDISVVGKAGEVADTGAIATADRVGGESSTAVGTSASGDTASATSHTTTPTETTTAAPSDSAPATVSTDDSASKPVDSVADKDTDPPADDSATAPPPKKTSSGDSATADA